MNLHKKFFWNNGLIKIDEKYKILNLFNKKYIDKLNNLRLEENAQIIRNSPISIVAEALDLYSNNLIGTKNIDLDGPIQKNASYYQEIIQKYFNFKGMNYYQIMNFIKILSIQFKKFTENIYFNYNIKSKDCNGEKIRAIRQSIIPCFINLSKLASHSWWYIQKWNFWTSSPKTNIWRSL